MCVQCTVKKLFFVSVLFIILLILCEQFDLKISVCKFRFGKDCEC